jgi:hypothetical protein
MELSTAQLTIRVVGIVALACAGFGLWYNFATFRAVLRERPDQADTPHFRKAFFVMSAICVVFYVALAWIGTEFIFGSSDRWAVFVAVLVAEVAYVLAVGMLWARSPHALSIAAATGVSNGGLVAQLLILFPIWAPVAIWLARERMAAP